MRIDRLVCIPCLGLIMVAKSILTPSASPPAGYETMTDEAAVREWLASFGGAIAQADYYDVFIEAGFDSLENMIFTADQLMDSIEGDKMKMGHALRIARDAEQMVQEIGSIGTKADPTVDKPEARLAGADSKKVAGTPPDFPPGQGNQPPTRDEVGGWIGKMIPWCRIWSPPVADAIIRRRDNPQEPITRIQSMAGVDDDDDVYLGAQLLARLPDKPRILLDETTQDESSGLRIIDILMKNLCKMDNDYLISLQDKFINQEPVNDPSKLTIKVVEWKNTRRSLINKRVPVSELTQLGSLKKMMQGLKPAEAAIEAAELIKERALTSSEILKLLENIASKHEPKLSGAKANTKPNPNPNNNQKNTTSLMADWKSDLPCFNWGLSKLKDCKWGDKCRHTHDPQKKNSDDPALLERAKQHPCPYAECKLGNKCVFKHN